MRTQLLCTFSKISEYSNTIENIKNFYKILFNKVYVLQNKDDVNELLLTYNIDSSTLNISSFFPNTISVHRKKDSNTIYTINSLNSLIKTLNNGILDQNYMVNWDDYTNSILLTDTTSDALKIVPTKLFKIIKI